MMWGHASTLFGEFLDMEAIMPKITILIADDHQLIRKGLRILLQSQEQFEVIGEAENGIALLQCLQKIRPDIILLDISMPDMTGLEVAQQIQLQTHSPHILLLTMYNTLAYIEEALLLGVSGYVLKDAAPHELFIAIETIMRGEVYLSPAISAQIMKGFQQKTPKSSADQLLTQRQLEVLRLVAKGCSSKEIARELSISIKTIETHRSQIMQRLDIHNMTGLVRYAVKMGLVD
ncbi:response regulator transcription factor [Moraxellaceae bacterium AER2_44_116]|nr:response regulator transcription factor [Moraxellaceae bacterium AER2_44_116]